MLIFGEHYPLPLTLYFFFFFLRMVCSLFLSLSSLSFSPLLLPRSPPFSSSFSFSCFFRRFWLEFSHFYPFFVSSFSFFSPCLLSYLLFPFLPFFLTEFISIFCNFSKDLLCLGNVCPFFFSFLFSLSYSHISSNNSSPFPLFFLQNLLKHPKRRLPFPFSSSLCTPSLQKIPWTLNSLLPTTLCWFPPLLRTRSLSIRV